MKIVVLLYTKNGVDYLGEQLQSLMKQDVSEKAELQIMVRDDASTDMTRDILDRYQREGKLTFYEGESIGKTRSFWELLEKAGEADYYAFCEQDDVWFPKKLSRAINFIETKAIIEGDDVDIAVSPLLYMSDYTVTNASLKPIKFARSKTSNYKDFEHSLLYSTMPGCTYVFNASARELMLRYDPSKYFDADYDDLARNIVYIVGKVVRDMVPTMYLRKNPGDSFHVDCYGGFFGKIKQYLAYYSGKNANVKSKLAKGLYETYGDGMDDEHALESLKQLATYKDDIAAKERLLTNSKFVTGTFNDKLFQKAVNSGKL